MRRYLGVSIRHPRWPLWATRSGHSYVVAGLSSFQSSLSLIMVSFDSVKLAALQTAFLKISSGCRTDTSHSFPTSRPALYLRVLLALPASPSSRTGNLSAAYCSFRKNDSSSLSCRMAQPPQVRIKTKNPCSLLQGMGLSFERGRRLHSLPHAPGLGPHSSFRGLGIPITQCKRRRRQTLGFS